MRLAPLLALALLVGCAGAPSAPALPADAVVIVETLAPGLTLHLATTPFDPARYDVVVDETGYVLGTADCDDWHGSDGGVPAIVVVAGWVVRDGERLDLDTSCMGSYDPGPDARGEPIGSFSAEALGAPGTWRIDGTFSDGAGTAEVTWTVGPTGTTRDRLVSGPALFE